MVVQNQSEISEGSAMPTDPQHTPTFIQPYPPPQKTQKPRKPKRKDTQVPQPSGPTDIVADEAVHKELGDSLVRVATIASSLVAEQDSGNITKTRSKATPNESSSLGTTSGGGPRGNTLQSDEDRLKLQELMELCINLQQRVLNLENTKTTQAIEIDSLKRRVKKLKKRNRLRTHGLKMLYKVGLSARVESSGDEEDLVSVQDDSDAEMFDVGTLTGDEVFAEQEVAAKDVNLTVDEVTLAQALAALKSVKPKVKWDVIKEPSVPISAAIASKKIFTTTITGKSLGQSKGKMVEPEPVKPTKKKVQNMLDEEIALKLQVEIDEEERIARHKDLKSKDFDSIKELFDKAFKRVNMFVDFRTDLVEGSSKRAEDELEQESTKKQKVDENKEIAELKELMEIIPDEEEKSYYQIVRADGKSQIYRVFSQMLKSFHMQDLEDLYKLVKAKYESTRLVEDLDLVLWNDLKTMFEPHVKDVIWRNQQAYKVLEWKLYDSCEVHFLRMQHMQIYMLVEKKYPLASLSLSQMLEKKLQIDYESKMAYQLFIVALIDVNAAQSKLVLLENFNENYSKCLRLLVKLQLRVQSYYCLKLRMLKELLLLV
ncbi:hypothetical protein Tco_1371826 [Tanacetum coccineum]